jgi:hypothetical protein
MCLNLKCDKINVTAKDQDLYEIKVQENISKEELLMLLNETYNLENDESFKGNILLRLRGVNTDLLTAAIKFSLEKETIKNPLMILNIINLIKIYNTLDESFFNNEDNYFTSIDSLLDVKLILRNDLKEFSKKLSIYFISLLKSYNKLTYTPADVRIDLPNVYKIILLSTDIMTLSGIFASSGDFNTKECVYINNGISILSQLLTKHSITMNFFNAFTETNISRED